MKIPQIRSTEPLSARQLPQVNPSVYSLSAKADIGLGEAISGAGSKLMEIVEREKQGREAIEVISAKTKAEIELKNLERNVEKDADFDNYEKNYVPQIDEVLNKYINESKSIGIRKKLKLSFEKLRGDSLINLRSLRDKKSIDIGRAKTLETADLIESQIETESDPNELGKLYGRLDVLLDETGGGKYVDPMGKEKQGAGFFSAEHTQVLKNHYAGKIRDKIKKSNLNNVILRISAGEFKKEDVAKLIKEYDIPKEAWPAIQSHATTIEKTKKIEDDETNITNSINEVKKEWPGFPDMQNILLTNSDWQKEHGLDSKLAHSAQARLKAEQDLIHDQDERKIGDLFVDGNYIEAIKLVGSSNYIKGDEKKIWLNAIESQRDKPEKIDPTVEVAEIVMINDLLSKNVNPRVIRNSVIFSPRLSGANKEQYINKLETKLNAEIKEGRDIGYKDIKDIIFPPARGLSLENLIQTPQQTTAIMKAQMSLDEWIDRQIKIEKYPTKNEIRNKAFELANTYNPSIGSRIEFMEEKAKQQVEEIKKAKEKKK